MKKVTKKFLALLTTVTMGVAALTACGNNAASNTTKSGSATSASGDKVSLSLGIWDEKQRPMT